LPEVFTTADDFDKYVQTLVDTNCIDNGKRIWWDIRPHPFFGTIEFRIFDMPATFDDMIALAALSQALVAKLAWLYKHGTMMPVLPRRLIDENKWRAMRYGLDAELIDFVQGQRLSARDAIHELLDFVDDVLDDLGSQCEIAHLRMLLEDPRGTGADRQIALYKETNSLRAVINFLMRQTMEGVTLEAVEQSLAG
jgi:carboxylate-amine ligase